MSTVIVLPDPPRTTDHRPLSVTVFDTSTGPLEVTTCACGRMFDAVRMSKHLEGRVK